MLLLAPTLAEAEKIIEKLGLERKKEDLFQKGSVLLGIIGVGKVQSAIKSFEFMKRKPKKVLLFGIAGAYPERANIGEVLAAEKEIYADELKELTPTEFQLIPPEIPIRKGVFLTLSKPSESLEEALKLAERFPEALCENMEGAAVAHAASFLNLRITEIRAISNIAGVRDKKKWKKEEAIEKLTRIVLQILEREGLP